MSPRRDDRSFPWPMRIVDADEPNGRLRHVEAVDELAAMVIGEWQSSLIHFYGGNPQPLREARGTVVRVINEDGDIETIELSTNAVQLINVEPEFREAWQDGELSG